jgi:tRNA uridine 5-carbamoylmethylation protein Kti12
MKTYQLMGIDTAMHLLRPGAKWEISNREITRWEDPRPKPSWDEIMFTIEKIKELEDAVPTILLRPASTSICVLSTRRNTTLRCA